MSEEAPRIPLSEPVVAGNEVAYVTEAISSGWLSSGPYISRLEDAVRETTGADHAIAMSSGTAALHIALLLAGVGPADEVLVPTLTFIAPVNAVRYVGAEPVFMDCDEHLNLDAVKVAEFLERECEDTVEGPRDRLTGRRVRAVVPVHVFGSPGDTAPLLEVCDRHGVAVIEDASESLGAYWTAGRLAGRQTGTVGRYGVYSFNGNKIVTCGGGGMLVTDDADAAARARHLINQAKADPVRYVHDEIGFNYRMTNIVAAIGTAQMEKLPGFIAARRANQQRYAERLDAVPGLRMLDAPAGTSPNWWFYSLIIEPAEFGLDRDAVMQALDAEGIQTRPIWYPNHLQAPYRGCGAYRIERATWFWERVLNLPCSSDLTAEQVERVCGAILAVR